MVKVTMASVDGWQRRRQLSGMTDWVRWPDSLAKRRSVPRGTFCTSGSVRTKSVSLWKEAGVPKWEGLEDCLGWRARPILDRRWWRVNDAGVAPVRGGIGFELTQDLCPGL